MKEKLKKIKRERYLINSSIDRLEQAGALEESINKKVFLKRESSILVKRTWSLLWQSLSLWFKMRR